MKPRIVIWCFLFITITSATNTNYTSPVQTDSGPVVGKILHTLIKSKPYYSYRGIPYAEPPVANLRFQPPVEKKPWTDNFVAESDVNRCIQIENGIIFGFEDCLYLHIYVPTNNNSNVTKPVLVWIHGGTFRSGYASSKFDGPDFLLEADVIVAAVQYRLGALGFLNLNHPNVSGNNGLKDQNLALKWIKNNIRNFGGDPDRITIMGQSAGGVSVDLHKLSKMSTGLFNQTISMSASPLCKYWAFQSHVEARTQAFLLGSKLGIKTENEDELINFFKTANASEIVKQTDSMPGLPFRPTLEKSDVAPDKPKFLTECTPKLYHEGNYNKGPHMMGFTGNEILLFAKSFDDLIQYNEDAVKSIQNSKFLNFISFVPKLISASIKTATKFEKVFFTEVIKELSDIFFVTDIDMTNRLLGKTNKYPVYYYHYLFHSSQSAHRSNGIENLDGVTHEDEMPYIFYRPHVKLDLFETRISNCRKRFVKLISNFVKYGNPTPTSNQLDTNDDDDDDKLINGIIWPPSNDNGFHLEINDTLVVHNERPISNLVKVYQKLSFGDSDIFNDCDKGLLPDIINSVLTVSGKLLEVVSDVKDSAKNVMHYIKEKIEKFKEAVKHFAEKIPFIGQFFK